MQYLHERYTRSGVLVVVDKIFFCSGCVCKIRTKCRAAVVLSVGVSVLCFALVSKIDTGSSLRPPAIYIYIYIYVVATVCNVHFSLSSPLLFETSQIFQKFLSFFSSTHLEMVRSMVLTFNFSI